MALKISTSNLYLTLKNCYLPFFIASLQYYVNQEASMVLACLAGGSCGLVILVLMSRASSGDQKMSVFFLSFEVNFRSLTLEGYQTLENCLVFVGK